MPKISQGFPFLKEIVRNLHCPSIGVSSFFGNLRSKFHMSGFSQKICVALNLITRESNELHRPTEKLFFTTISVETQS